jgi:hypothetical protein
MMPRALIPKIREQLGVIAQRYTPDRPLSPAPDVEDLAETACAT